MLTPEFRISENNQRRVADVAQAYITQSYGKLGKF